MCKGACQQALGSMVEGENGEPPYGPYKQPSEVEQGNMYNADITV